jgi:hypothetical protein
MKRIGLWIGLILITTVIGFGFYPWPLTGFFARLLEAAESRSGWRLSIAQARWIPWKGLEFDDLRLETPGGGRLHLTSARIHPGLGSLLKGNLVTHGRLGDIRIDPGSWGIHRPLAQELLSTSPVTTQGSVVLRWESDRWRITDLSLDGPFLQLQARGWLNRQRQTDLSLQGALDRTLLVGMNLLKANEAVRSAGPWEPFQMSLTGILERPEISFTSGFLTISLKSNEEKTA